MRQTLILTWLLLCFSRALSAMPSEEARHLMARTGFGVNAMQLTQLSKQDYVSTVKQMLASHRQTPVTPAPDWVDRLPPLPAKRKNMSASEKQQLQQWIRNTAQELKGWWFQEMLNTDSPLTERMTLFWHNHFTSSIRKVRWPPFLYQQNLLLRHHALGNFRDLLNNIAKDPAMLIYLDNARNFRNKGNENFARELLELFTLGEGEYTEQDIKEAARAFTGWTLQRKTGKFRFARWQHDYGEKEFLGKRGQFDGDDIIEIILQQPQTAIHITEKLWWEFISATPDETEIKRLAAIFRDNNYEIKPLLRAMFLSKTFRDTGNYATLIKSPVELLVGTLHSLQLTVANNYLLVRAARFMGQDIFNPPTVKGWPGGTTWIDANSLLIRQQILEKLSHTLLTPTMVSQPMLPVDSQFKQLTQQMLLASPPTQPATATTRIEWIQQLLLDPVYQLK